MLLYAHFDHKTCRMDHCFWSFEYQKTIHSHTGISSHIAHHEQRSTSTLKFRTVKRAGPGYHIQEGRARRCKQSKFLVKPRTKTPRLKTTIITTPLLFPYPYYPANATLTTSNSRKKSHPTITTLHHIAPPDKHSETR